MRDNHSHLKYLSALDPILGNNDTEGTGITIDRLGAESVEFVCQFGISGDTLAAGLNVKAILQHGDLANASDMAFVPDADMIGGLADGAGGICLIDDPAEDPAAFKVGYKGSKRYLRVFLDFTGTHTNGIPISALAILGQLRYEGQNSMALGATGI